MHKFRNKRYGFTIMEIIISSLLLAIIVAASFSVFVASERKIRYIGRKLQAANFVREKFEDLKDAVRQDTWDDGDLKLTNGGWTEWYVFPEDFGTKWGGQRRYKVEEVSDDEGNPMTYRKITVEVQWNEPQL